MVRRPMAWWGVVLLVGCVGSPPPPPSQSEGSSTGSPSPVGSTSIADGTLGSTGSSTTTDSSGSSGAVVDTTTTGSVDTAWLHELLVSGHAMGPLDDVPVRVSLSTSDLVGGIGPGDVYLLTDGGTPLPFEVETWDDAAIELWVRVPTVGRQATSIFMGYGRSDPPRPLPTSDVWGEALGAWHLSDGLADSSAEGNDGVMGAAAGQGYCGGGHAYDGTVYDDLPAVGGGLVGTVQLWFRASPRQVAPADGLALLFHGSLDPSADGFGPFSELYVGIRLLNDTPRVQLRGFGFFELQDIAISEPGRWLDDQWHQVTAVWDQPTSYSALYIDGQLVDADASIPMISPFSAFVRLGGSAVTPQRSFVGAIDEVRFHDRLFAGSRIQIEYAAQLPDFVVVGPAQPEG